MSVFVSTGGNKQLTPKQSIEAFKKGGITSIELSGGVYSENIVSDLINLKIKYIIIFHQQKTLLSLI